MSLELDSVVDVARASSFHPGKRYLILAGDGGLWEALQLALEDEGAECSVARALGTPVIPDSTEVDPRAPAWFPKLLAALDVSSRPLTAVVCLAPAFDASDLRLASARFALQDLTERNGVNPVAILCAVPRSEMARAKVGGAGCSTVVVDGEGGPKDCGIIVGALSELLRERSGPSLRERLERLDPGVRLRACVDAIGERVAAALGIPASLVDKDTAFASFGVDSLKALELRVALQNLTGLHLPATQLFDHPTPGAIAAHILRRFGGSDTEVSGAVQGPGEPMAIIGMACRFPGHANSPDAFWRLLCDGIEAVEEVPASRFDIEAYYDPDLREPRTPGTTVSRRMGAIDDFDRFDAEFFGISAREAKEMDPQQRVLLEVCWEAFEDACIDVTRLEGSATGVFVGLIPSGYVDLCDPTAYATTGTSSSVAGGRISYCFGLRGPSVTIDTACSSSLVAAHLACQSLRRRESRLAIVAGVNVIVNSNGHVAMSQLGALSPDGSCKTFDDSANGYVRGEGCGAIVLKPLEEARKDGDRIWAVLRGSAVNQDGRSNGLTAPSGVAQQMLLRDALRDAGVQGGDLDYVEAHGTGTALGDPIELQALDAVTRVGRDLDRPLLVGSCKPNVGHLEAAAGMAGLIKTILCLHQGKVPPSVNCRTLNTRVDWDDVRIEVVQKLRDWPVGNDRPLAGVSAFGFSGTNAHVVLERALQPSDKAEARADEAAAILTVSARSKESLLELCRRSRRQIDERRTEFARIAGASNRYRAHHPYRAAFVGRRAEDVLAQLDESALVRLTDSKPRSKMRVAFLCTGQGAQFPAMARWLYGAEAAFREVLDAIDRVSAKHLPQSLLRVLLSEDPAIHRTRFAQPALFAFETAMASLWQRRGVSAEIFLGHSVGEIVAAYLAGVFSFEDAVRLVCWRGRLVDEVPGAGAMLALSVDRADAEEWVRGRPDVSVAAYNAPGSIVVSGFVDGIERIAQEALRRGVKAQRLVVSHGFHSPQVEPMLDEFEVLARTIPMSEPRLPIVSALTGEVADAQIATPEYWRRQLRAPVDFERAALVAAQHANLFLEVGPQPALSALAARTTGGTVRHVASWRSNQDVDLHLARATALLYEAGVPIDFDAIGPEQVDKVAPPPYPFRRLRHWTSASKQRGPTAARVHPLLGSRIDCAASIVVHEAELSPTSPDYLGDHRVFGRPVVPAAAIVELLFAAGEQVATGGMGSLEDIRFDRPLVLDERRPLRIQTVATPNDARGHDMALYAWRADATSPRWEKCASGRYVTGGASEASPGSADAARVNCPAPLDPAQLYVPERLSGLEYGPAFRGLRSLQVGRRCALAEVSLPPAQGVEVQSYLLHPALLDASFHALIALRAPDGTTYVPTSIDRARVFSKSASEVIAYVELLTDPDLPTVRANCVLWDRFGERVASIEGLALRRVSSELVSAKEALDNLYELAWTSAPRVALAAAEDVEPVRWIVISVGGATATGLGDGIAKQLDVELRSIPIELDLSADSEALLDIERLVGALFERHATELGDPAAAFVVVCDPSNTVDPARAAHILTFGVIAVLKRASTRSHAVRVVTAGAVSVHGEAPTLSVAPITGLVRSLQEEHEGLLHLDLDPRDPEDSLRFALADIRRPPSDEGQIAFRSGERWVPRLVKAGAVPAGLLGIPEAPNVQLGVARRGSLESLLLEPCELEEPGRGEVRLRVMAAGLNFRDVLNALGMYAGKVSPLGCECVASVDSLGPDVEGLALGDVVMGLATGAFRSRVNTPAFALAKKPNNLSVPEAATIPIAFLTALFAFKHLAELRRGHKVLIHSAAGGVGMAAIQLAHAMGLEIFATASPSKWDAVRALGVDHVANSRTLEFADQVRQWTGGAGVDAVLNSFTGPHLRASLGLLSPGGYFLEMGKAEILDSEELERLAPGIRYRPFDLAEASPDQMREMLGDLVRAFEDGTLRPLPRTDYKLADAPLAFRQMAQAKHIGKNVFRLRDHAPVPWVRPESSYLITGAFGALGLALAEALAQAGAARLLLIGRHAPSTEVRSQLDAIEARGTKVEVACADVSDLSAMTEVFARTDARASLRGIFHVAGTLADAPLDSITLEDFRAVASSKISGAWNLHRLSQEIALDHFVLYSSGASLTGSAGQGCYGAANGFLDALAQYRQSLGQPALTLNWGPWKDGGMGRRDRTVLARWAASGIDPLRTDQGIALLRRALDLDRAELGALNVSWPRYLARYAAGRSPAMLKNLGGAAAPATGAAGTLKRLVAKAEKGDKSRLALDYVSGVVRSTLNLSAEADLSEETDLRSLGVDSLTAVELRNRFADATGLNLRRTLLFDHATIGDLATFLVDELGGPTRPAAPALTTQS